jgi:dipeptidase E
MREVSDCGVIFVAGGNTFYLLQEVRKSGFDTVINDLLTSEKVYVGSSAGSVLVAPDIGLVSRFDDPSDAPELKNYLGLNLVDYVVLPHYGNPKHEEEYQKVIVKAQELGLKTKTLRDDEYSIGTI